MLKSSVLNVVIDDRKKLSEIDETPLLKASQRFVMGEPCAQKVFKDYILSSELFYLESKR